MIIKSLARKRPSFRQLIHYMGRDGGAAFSRNLYDVGDNPRAVAEAFERNHAHLPARRRGNALYHEIIVLPAQPGLSDARQRQILTSLAERYCDLRAPDNLAYGRIHQDTDHSHIHLMISANAARSKTRTRLSRAEFADIQARLEREARTRFPELQDQARYDRAPIAKRSSPTVRQDAMERNNPKMPFKTFYHDALRAKVPDCRNEAELHHLFACLNVELYQRGKHLGLRNLNTGARYRLSTLGVEDLIKTQMRQWERRAERSASSKAVEKVKPATPDRTQQSPAKPSRPTRSDRQPDQSAQRPDPRAAELLRQRRDMAERVDRTLRGFDDDLSR